MAPKADRALLVLARTRGHSARAEHAVAAFSRLGEHGAGWVALGLLGALGERDQGRRHAWLRGARAVVGAYALNQAIKFTLRRPRPELRGLPALTSTVSSLSFPSAHATTSFAAARAYQNLLPARPTYAVATLLALSRPYLGVHYPSDVLAGALLGLAVGELALRRQALAVRR
jgi:membrane-associated phospholipid phosphatase